jgi:uncharacterized protein YndB with AHSA1/START domain
MSESAAETRTVTVERDMPFPPDKIWRALTQPHLIAEWLMKTDFAPVVGRDFTLSADWGAVACKVLTLEPGRALSYTWAANGLESIVTWTLTPTPAGARLRMEQTGFRADQRQAYGGAMAGWPRFFEQLQAVLARLG